MKKTLIIAGSMVFAIGAFSQGTVNFNNFISGSIKAPVYDVDTGNPTIEVHGQTAAGLPAGGTVYTGAAIAGTGFTAQLWGHVGTGVSEAQLVLLGSTSFRTGTGAGLINALGLPGGNALLAVPGAPIDGNSYKGTFQLRAWNNQGGTVTDWAGVLANQSIPHGDSGVFSPGGDLGGTGTPPATAPNLTGITSFNLHVVPEPSMIALGALGLGALLLRRRNA